MAVALAVLAALTVVVLPAWRAPAAQAAPLVPAPPGTTLAYAVRDRATGRSDVSAEHMRFRSASVVKLLIALDYVEGRGGAAIPGGDLALLQSMLRSSDDDAASTLWVRGGYGQIVQRMVPRIGLVDTQPPTDPRYWGYTAISAADVVTVYGYLLDRASAQARDLVLGNIGQATQCAADGFDQFFGIPRAVAGRKAVKQGWSGYGSGPSPSDRCTGGAALNTAPTPEASLAAEEPPPAEAASRAATTMAAPGLDLSSRAMHTTGLIDSTRIVVVLTLTPTTTSYGASAASLTDFTQRLYAATTTRSPGERVASGGVARVHATDVGGSTVLGNLTVADPVGAGYTTAWPCAEPRPGSSSNNYVAGQVVPNFVAVRADAMGDVCFFAQTATHLVWDQVGATTAFPVTNAKRLLDTRVGGNPRVASGGVARVHATDVGGSTVLGNLTVADPVGAGYTTAWPCAEPRPGSSSNNYVAGQVVPNFVAVRADAMGDVCFFAQTATHLVWDQVGDTTAFPVSNARRLLDSRVN